MNWTIEYIELRQYVRISYEGFFSVGEQVAAIEDLISRQFWQPGMSVLADYRKLDFGKTDISTMQQLSVSHQNKDRSIGTTRFALLMKSVSDFGRGRQYELLSKEKISAKLEVFLDEDEALGWLLKS